MRDELKNKIAAQAQKLLFAENLPAEIEGFALKKIFAVEEDKFIFLTRRRQIITMCLKPKCGVEIF